MFKVLDPLPSSPWGGVQRRWLINLFNVKVKVKVNVNVQSSIFNVLSLIREIVQLINLSLRLSQNRFSLSRALTDLISSLTLQNY